MVGTEFAAYRDYFIVDYAAEIAANFGHPIEQSQAIAAAELADDLPQTVDTADNFLLCIERDGQETIGYLWYKPIEQGASIFILDFVVFEAYRSLGYGKAALLALETRLASTDTTQIKLRVAFKNTRARQLYETLGFQITGYNMVKILTER